MAGDKRSLRHKDSILVSGDLVRTCFLGSPSVHSLSQTASLWTTPDGHEPETIARREERRDSALADKQYLDRLSHVRGAHGRRPYLQPIDVPNRILWYAQIRPTLGLLFHRLGGSCSSCPLVQAKDVKGRACDLSGRQVNQPSGAPTHSLGCGTTPSRCAFATISLGLETSRGLAAGDVGPL